MLKTLNFREMRRKNKGKREGNYIFPDFLAKAMSKVDLRTQYEATMLSTVLISAGLILTIIYFMAYMQFELWYKIIFLINGIAGLGFMWSSLVTTYQQYKTYMDAIKFQREMKGGLSLNGKENRQEA